MANWRFRACSKQTCGAISRILNIFTVSKNQNNHYWVRVEEGEPKTDCLLSLLAFKQNLAPEGTAD